MDLGHCTQGIARFQWKHVVPKLKLIFARNFKCVHQVSNAEINLMNLFIKIDYKIKSFSFYWPSIFVLSIVLVFENIAGVSVSVLWWEIKFLKLLDGRQCSAFYFLYYFMIYSVSHNFCYLIMFSSIMVFSVQDAVKLLVFWISCI